MKNFLCVRWSGEGAETPPPPPVAKAVGGTPPRWGGIKGRGGIIGEGDYIIKFSPR